MMADIFNLDIKEFEKEIDKLLENMTDERITRKWIVRGEITMKKIKRIIILMLILILASSTVYAKARISGARTHISSKTYTKSSTSKSSSSKSSSTSTTNVKGFNSSGTTSTILTPSWLPFMFLMHGNNYSINGEDKKIDYTLSNIAIKII